MPVYRINKTKLELQKNTFDKIRNLQYNCRMAGTEIEHPEFLGCRMLGEEGAGCGIAGCWASFLIENARDLSEPERSERIEEIKKDARENECKNSQVTN